MRPTLRIVNEKPMGAHTQILLVREDGTEEDITRALRAASISLDLRAGEVNRVQIDCLAIGVDVTAHLDALRIHDVTYTRDADVTEVTDFGEEGT